jgi:hypothetical protein
MLRIVAIALLSFAAALITAAQEKTDASADKSMILALESPWNQAEIHPDASAATAIIADTFISTDHHGVILNQSRYLPGLKDLSFKPEEIVQLRYQRLPLRRRRHRYPRLSNQRHG